MRYRPYNINNKIADIFPIFPNNTSNIDDPLHHKRLGKQIQRYLDKKLLYQIC